MSLEDDISLRPLIERHGMLMRELNIWLLNELWRVLDLSEVNDLRIQRNPLLAGVDLETAWRMSEPNFFAER